MQNLTQTVVLILFTGSDPFFSEHWLFHYLLWLTVYVYVGGKTQHSYEFTEKVAICEVVISYRKVSISVNFNQYRIVLKILVSPITRYNRHKCSAQCIIYYLK